MFSSRFFKYLNSTKFFLKNFNSTIWTITKKELAFRYAYTIVRLETSNKLSYRAFEHVYEAFKTVPLSELLLWQPLRNALLFGSKRWFSLDTNLVGYLNTAFKNILKKSKRFTLKTFISPKILIIRQFWKRQSNVVIFKKITIGFFTLYKSIKSLFLPVTASIFVITLIFDFFSVSFLRNIAAWSIVGFLFFWLMSGFNFFIKRYRFGKFTSAILRFWKRTNSYFWMIEGFLFLLFFYYYLNSSQEVFYMFDESNLNQTFLLSPVSFYLSIIILLFLIIYSFFLVLNLPSFTYKQLLTHVLIITAGIIYIFLLECYQFYYVITMFFENIWQYKTPAKTWELGIESPKLRVKQQYFILALIAKYWHFLFIFFSWLFMVTKSYEQKRIHYSLLGVNIQNLLLLLLLNMLFIINWVKWVCRRFADIIFYWFFTDLNNWNTLSFFNELNLFL